MDGMGWDGSITTARHRDGGGCGVFISFSEPFRVCVHVRIDGNYARAVGVGVGSRRLCLGVSRREDDGRLLELG